MMSLENTYDVPFIHLECLEEVARVFGLVMIINLGMNAQPKTFCFFLGLFN